MSRKPVPELQATIVQHPGTYLHCPTLLPIDGTDTPPLHLKPFRSLVLARNEAAVAATALQALGVRVRLSFEAVERGSSAASRRRVETCVDRWCAARGLVLRGDGTAAAAATGRLRGVTARARVKHGQRYEASVRVPRVGNLHLGSFPTAEHAGAAWNLACATLRDLHLHVTVKENPVAASVLTPAMAAMVQRRVRRWSRCLGARAEATARVGSPMPAHLYGAYITRANAATAPFLSVATVVRAAAAAGNPCTTIVFGRFATATEAAAAWNYGHSVLRQAGYRASARVNPVPTLDILSAAARTRIEQRVSAWAEKSERGTAAAPTS
jgi:hypothetical protein